MNTDTQALSHMVDQAKAPVLSQVEEAGGQGALTPVQSPQELVPVTPKHLDEAAIKDLEAQADKFIETVKTDPSNWELGNFIFSLGREIMDKTQAQVSLYDRKMGSVLKNVATDDASPVARNILA
ncbi:MAG: hypothetical protein MI749_11085, partial [Desulfovibrionales bacterium]|nr:hypothetical protein [Desulfovibrionales bacterium]